MYYDYLNLHIIKNSIKTALYYILYYSSFVHEFLIVFWDDDVFQKSINEAFFGIQFIRQHCVMIDSHITQILHLYISKYMDSLLKTV